MMMYCTIAPSYNTRSGYFMTFSSLTKNDVQIVKRKMQISLTTRETVYEQCERTKSLEEP